MTTGTKSVLFGVHAFWFHPITVWLAWVGCYERLPTFYESIAILVHDLGYWGCKSMDDHIGKRHPLVGAELAYHAVQWCESLKGNAWDSRRVRNLANAHYQLALGHSRSMAKIAGIPVSPLFLPDKKSILLEPKWFYYLRAWLSGELGEYYQAAKNDGSLPEGATPADWLTMYRDKVKKLT